MQSCLFEPEIRGNHPLQDGVSGHLGSKAASSLGGRRLIQGWTVVQRGSQVFWTVPGTELNSLSDEEGNAMAESESYPETTRSVDSLREMRLTALLGDLIGEQGRPGRRSPCG